MASRTAYGRRASGQAVGRVFRAILIAIVVVALVLFALVWFSIIAGVVFVAPAGAYFFPDQQWLPIFLLVNILFIIGLPLVSIVMGVARLAFRRSRLSGSWRMGLSILWGLNLASFFLLGSIGARQFSASGEVTRVLGTDGFAADTVRLSNFTPSDEAYEDVYFGFQEVKMDFIQSRLTIRQSEDGEWRLEETVSSRGRDRAEAESLANALISEVKMEPGHLRLPQDMSIGRVPKFRAQEINYVLYVPEGAIVQPEHIHYHASVPVHDAEHRSWSRSDYLYRMEADGLHCLNCEQESDNMETREESDFQDFTRLSFSGPMKINIDQGDTWEVRVTEPDQYHGQVKVAQSGDQLAFTTEVQDPDASIRIYLTMPTLDDLVLHGTDDVRLRGFAGQAFQVDATGSFSVKAYMELDQLNATLADGADFELIGRAGLIEASLEQEARLHADRASVNEAHLTLSNDSQAKLRQGVNITQQVVDDGSSVRIVE